MRNYELSKRSESVLSQCAEIYCRGLVNKQFHVFITGNAIAEQ